MQRTDRRPSTKPEKTTAAAWWLHTLVKVIMLPALVPVTDDSEVPELATAAIW